MNRFVGYVRHLRPAALVATFLPLALLLWMQYRWLTRFEQASTISNQAALANSLEAIHKDVQYFYHSAAELALNMPSVVFSGGRLQEAASIWDARPIEGATRLFLVDFSADSYGSYWLYNPQKHALEPMPGDVDALAIILAATPWQVAIHQGRPVRSGFDVNERDPEHRLILNPIPGGDGHIVGLTGMMLDEAYLRDTLLPQAIEQALTKLPPEWRPGVAVSVRDARDRVLVAAPAAAGPVTATRPLAFVFTDWTLNLHGGAAAAARWARASLVANMALAFALAAVLLGGITFALRAAERAMTLSQLKSEFVSNVSHELRTPLASIRVFAEFLRLGRVAAPEKVQEYGASIEAESRRLTRLIDNILDFSRIESGRKTYRFEPVDLQAVVRATAQTFELPLRQQGFTLDLAPLPDGAAWVEADPDALAQALANLIDNAVKYSGEARVIVVRVQRGTGPELGVEVRDQGVGIAPSEHEKIFERFHRVGTGLVHDVKGSGLGLAIVRHIIEAHRGRVEVESAPGAGSAFTIWLPAIPAPAAPAGALEA